MLLKRKMMGVVLISGFAFCVISACALGPRQGGGL